MEGRGGSEWRPECSPSAAEISSADYPALNPPLETLPNSNLIYNLRDGTSDSNAFFAESARFAEKIVARIDKHAGAILDRYYRHLRVVNEEAPRSRGE